MPLLCFYASAVASPNASESVESSALSETSEIVRAVDHDSLRVVQAWVHGGHSPLEKISNKIHENLVERAAAHRSVQVFEFLVQTAHAENLDAHLTDSRGTPLLITLSSLAVPGMGTTAVYERMIAQMLVVSPALVHARDHAYVGDGRTALHQAAAVGNVQVLELLMAHGADVNAKNAIGETPLHLAARFGHLAAARFLVKSGAILDEKTKFTRTTPLMAAAEMGHENIIRMLMESGAKKDIRDAFGKTAPDRFHEYCRLYASSAKRSLIH